MRDNKLFSGYLNVAIFAVRDAIFCMTRIKIALLYNLLPEGTALWEGCLNYRGVPRHIVQYKTSIANYELL